MGNNLPYPRITISYAQTLDGRIATRTGKSRYISDEASLEMNQQMRREHDGILVGIGTVLKDNPLLTCRLDGCTDPVRVIVDSQLRTPPDSKLAQSAGEVQTLVYCSPEHLKSHSEQALALQSAGFELIPLERGHEEPQPPDGSPPLLPLDLLLRDLNTRGVSKLMVEGGAGIITSLLRQGLWHKMTVVSVGKIMGSGVEAVGDLGISNLNQLLIPEIEDIRIVGREIIWDIVNPEPPELPSSAAPREEFRPVPVRTKKTTARTVYFTGLKQVEVREEALPRSRSGELTVHSLASAISPGTERNFYLGRFERGRSGNPDMDFTGEVLDYPFSYGYINVVRDLNGRRYFAFAPHSDALVLREKSLIPLPDALGTEQAVFIPHLETALSIVHDSRIQPGDRVIITGAGVVGTLCTRILRSIPGVEIHMIDPAPRKSRWFPKGEFQVDFHGLKTADVCIEVSGNPDALQPLLKTAAFEGRVTVASWYGDREISVNLGKDFHTRRLQLISSQVSTMGGHMGSNWNKARRMDKVIRLLNEIPVEDLITHRFPFNKASEAFALLDSEELLGLPLLVPDFPN